MRPRTLWIAILPLLILLASPRPSWAWRGRGGWHGWWWGGPYWGYPYYPYYGPYYDPYYHPPEYPRSDTRAAKEGPAEERAQVEFDYADGDISKAARDARLREIDERASKAPSETSASPAALPAARRDLGTVTDLHLELRTLLDQKFKEGNITQPQHAAEAEYLDQLDQQAHAAATTNGGILSANQEAAFVRKLHKAYYAISHNLIYHD